MSEKVTISKAAYLAMLELIALQDDIIKSDKEYIEKLLYSDNGLINYIAKACVDEALRHRFTLGMLLKRGRGRPRTNLIKQKRKPGRPPSAISDETLKLLHAEVKEYMAKGGIYSRRKAVYDYLLALMLKEPREKGEYENTIRKRARKEADYLDGCFRKNSKLLK